MLKKLLASDFVPGNLVIVDQLFGEMEFCTVVDFDEGQCREADFIPVKIRSEYSNSTIHFYRPENLRHRFPIRDWRILVPFCASLSLLLTSDLFSFH